MAEVKYTLLQMNGSEQIKKVKTRSIGVNTDEYQRCTCCIFHPRPPVYIVPQYPFGFYPYPFGNMCMMPLQNPACAEPVCQCCTQFLRSSCSTSSDSCRIMSEVSMNPRVQTSKSHETSTSRNTIQNEGPIHFKTHAEDFYPGYNKNGTLHIPTVSDVEKPELHELQNNCGRKSATKISVWENKNPIEEKCLQCKLSEIQIDGQKNLNTCLPWATQQEAKLYASDHSMKTIKCLNTESETSLNTVVDNSIRNEIVPKLNLNCVNSRDNINFDDEIRAVPPTELLKYASEYLEKSQRDQNISDHRPGKPFSARSCYQKNEIKHGDNNLVKEESSLKTETCYQVLTQTVKNEIVNNKNKSATEEDSPILKNDIRNQQYFDQNFGDKEGVKQRYYENKELLESLLLPINQFRNSENTCKDSDTESIVTQRSEIYDDNETKSPNTVPVDIIEILCCKDAQHKPAKISKSNKPARQSSKSDDHCMMAMINSLMSEQRSSDKNTRLNKLLNHIEKEKIQRIQPDLENDSHHLESTSQFNIQQLENIHPDCVVIPANKTSQSKITDPQKSCW